MSSEVKHQVGKVTEIPVFAIVDNEGGCPMAHRDEATANSFASVWSQADATKVFHVIPAILTIPEEQ